MNSDILIYATPNEKKKVVVNLKNDTLWLSLDQNNRAIPTK